MVNIGGRQHVGETFDESAARDYLRRRITEVNKFTWIGSKVFGLDGRKYTFRHN